MKLTVLCGGVGGSRFLRALCRAVSPCDITAIVNTGDDLLWNGLNISPDLDIVTYTLAGIINEQTGWGIKGDTFNCLDFLKKLGADCWFNLGDRDLALQIHRTAELKAGKTLSQITKESALALGVEVKILPMCDSPMATMIDTGENQLTFQEYLVRDKCSHHIKRIYSLNSEEAKPSKAVLAALEGADAILFAPSNPFVSIGTILSIEGIRKAIENAHCPRIGVSPIIEGNVVKGPAAAMLKDLGYEVSCAGVASCYKGLLDHFFISRSDSDCCQQILNIGIEPQMFDIMLDTPQKQEKLAQKILEVGGAHGGNYRASNRNEKENLL